MAQFTVYSSADAGGPGPVTGQAGDLIRVLDLVLVAGYPGKAAAGWTNPVATAGNIASYQNASPANGGNGFGFVLNDNGPNVTSTYKEAWATGWETVVGVGAPVGTGTGQFPTPAQLLVTGHVVVRKSTTADATGRAWVCHADGLTMYLFIFDGSVVNAYQAFFFGDLFSLAGNGDDYRAMIFGRATENTGVGGTQSNLDSLSLTATTTTSLGLYTPRGFGGVGASLQGYATGAISFTNITAVNNPAANIGVMQAPNGPDNAYYFSPICFTQAVSQSLRGRFRGLYHTMHPLATFADSQVISGAADYAGKTFQAVVKGVNGGMWLVETSNTLETN